MKSRAWIHPVLHGGKKEKEKEKTISPRIHPGKALRNLSPDTVSGTRPWALHCPLRTLAPGLAVPSRRPTAHLHAPCPSPQGPPAGRPCPATRSHPGLRHHQAHTLVHPVSSLLWEPSGPSSIDLVLGRQLELNKCWLPGWSLRLKKCLKAQNIRCPRALGKRSGLGAGSLLAPGDAAAHAGMGCHRRWRRAAPRRNVPAGINSWFGGS